MGQRAAEAASGAARPPPKIPSRSKHPHGKLLAKKNPAKSCDSHEQGVFSEEIISGGARTQKTMEAPGCRVKTWPWAPRPEESIL